MFKISVTFFTITLEERQNKASNGIAIFQVRYDYVYKTS
jgi:hypothetical protein